MNQAKSSAILNHHLVAFGNNSFDEIMKDYTEESEIHTIDGVVKGLENIRSFFVKMFGLIPTGSEFEMKQLTVTENVAHIIWASKSAVAHIPFGADTFVFENDKIKSHTVAAHVITQ